MTPFAFTKISNSIMVLFPSYFRLIKSFCAVNYFAKSKASVFSNNNFGRQHIFHYLDDFCSQSGISGANVQDTVTAHVLRGTFITELFELGPAPTAVALSNEHRSLKSLESYKNVQGDLGLP